MDGGIYWYKNDVCLCDFFFFLIFRTWVHDSGKSFPLDLQYLHQKVLGGKFDVVSTPEKLFFVTILTYFND